MRLVRRPLAAGEFDHELVWLTVSILAAVGGGLWLWLGLPWPRCAFLAITGYPCLTCGATRCAIALAHADLGSALLWNPLATIALAAVVLFDVYALIVLVMRLPRLRIVDWTRREKHAVRIAVVTVLLLNWAFLLAHRMRY
jgi:hypothetical protein